MKKTKPNEKVDMERNMVKGNLIKFKFAQLRFGMNKCQNRVKFTQKVKRCKEGS